MRYQIVEARARVQDHARSGVFEEVRNTLRAAQRQTDNANKDLQLLMKQMLQNAQRRADLVRHRLAPAQLRERVSQARARFDFAYAACNVAGVAQVDQAKQRLRLGAAALDALSPLAVLERGYAIAQNKDGRLLRDARTVSTGDPLHVRLARGSLNCIVDSAEEN